MSSRLSSACCVWTVTRSGIASRQRTAGPNDLDWNAALRLGYAYRSRVRPSDGAWVAGEFIDEKGDQVVKVVVKDREEFEQALREFRRKVQEQGLVREMRRRAHYVPPAEARKIKSLRARRRRSR